MLKNWSQKFLCLVFIFLIYFFMIINKNKLVMWSNSWHLMHVWWIIVFTNVDLFKNKRTFLKGIKTYFILLILCRYRWFIFFSVTVLVIISYYFVVVVSDFFPRFFSFFFQILPSLYFITNIHTLTRY